MIMEIIVVLKALNEMLTVDNHCYKYNRELVICIHSFE